MTSCDPKLLDYPDVFG